MKQISITFYYWIGFEAKLSTSTIARQLGMSKMTLYARLRKHNWKQEEIEKIQNISGLPVFQIYEKEIAKLGKSTSDFYNTNNQSGNDLEDSKQAAIKQNEIIYDYFVKNKGKMFTAREIWTNCFNRSIQLTSVRRAITTLSNRTELFKCDKSQMVIGEMNKPVYRWYA